MPKIFFFQLPKLNKYCLGAALASTQQVVKKLKMDHLWVYTQSHLMPQRLQNVIKKKQNKTKKQKGHASYWNFEYMYSIGR